MKSNIHKKMTFEDKFDRRFACWVKNCPKAWRWYKVQNRRKFRRIMKAEFLAKESLMKQMGKE